MHSLTNLSRVGLIAEIGVIMIAAIAVADPMNYAKASAVGGAGSLVRFGLSTKVWKIRPVLFLTLSGTFMSYAILAMTYGNTLDENFMYASGMAWFVGCLQPEIGKEGVGRTLKRFGISVAWLEVNEHHN